MGAPTIAVMTAVPTSGSNRTNPACITPTSTGKLFITDGFAHPRVWNGVSPSAQDAGIIAPLTDPTGAITSSAGSLSEGTYIAAYRYVDADGNFSSLSTLVSKDTVDSDKIVWTVHYSNQTLIPSASRYRVTRLQLFRSLVNNANILYLVSDIANVGAGTTVTINDTVSDDALKTGTALPLKNADKTLNANRFDPPPDWMSVTCWQQDRLLMAVPAVYSTGTARISSAGVITGTATAWDSLIAGDSPFLTLSGISHPFIDRYIYLRGAPRPYRITSYSSATVLGTTDDTTDGPSAAVPYMIVAGPDEWNTIYYCEPLEPESWPIEQNNFSIGQTTGTFDRIVGLMPHGAFTYAVMQRHLYRLMWAKQPKIDVNPSLSVSRGAFNNRCWASIEDTAYLMDEYGIYAFSGGSIQPIGAAVQNYWRDGLIDFAKSPFFLVRAFPKDETVKFFFSLVSDTNALPQRAFCYNYRFQRWSEEWYPFGVGAASLLDTGSGEKPFVGSSDDVFLTPSGYCDWVTAPISGTITAGVSAGLIVDSTASFPATVVGAPVVITSGTYKGLIGRVSARGSATSITIDSLNGTAPNEAVGSYWYNTPYSFTTSTAQITLTAGDTYVIGAIPYIVRFGTFEIVSAGNSAQTTRVIFKPTTNVNEFSIRNYYNHSQTPINATMDVNDRGDGCVQTAGSPDGVVAMKANQYEDTEIAGLARKSFVDNLHEDMPSNRWLTPEMVGFQYLDRIEFFGVEVDGAR